MCRLVKPTSKGAQAVLADFKNITNGTTFSQIVSFVNSDFEGEGHELEAVALAKFNPSPAFLNNVTQPIVKAFSQTVHGYWTQLIRRTNSSTLCGGNNTCESSLIPLNHTFVVPGESGYVHLLPLLCLNTTLQVGVSESNITGIVSGSLKV